MTPSTTPTPTLTDRTAKYEFVSEWPYKNVYNEVIGAIKTDDETNVLRIVAAEAAVGRSVQELNAGIFNLAGRIDWTFGVVGHRVLNRSVVLAREDAVLLEKDAEAFLRGVEHVMRGVIQPFEAHRQYSEKDLWAAVVEEAADARQRRDQIKGLVVDVDALMATEFARDVACVAATRAWTGWRSDWVQGSPDSVRPGVRDTYPEIFTALQQLRKQVTSGIAVGLRAYREEDYGNRHPYGSYTRPNESHDRAAILDELGRAWDDGKVIADLPDLFISKPGKLLAIVTQALGVDQARYTSNFGLGETFARGHVVELSTLTR